MISSLFVADNAMTLLNATSLFNIKNGDDDDAFIHSLFKIVIMNTIMNMLKSEIINDKKILTFVEKPCYRMVENIKNS